MATKLFALGNHGNYVRFQVLMAASIKFGVFWDVVPCTDYIRAFIALMMEAVCTSDTSVHFVTTRRYIPEDSKFQDNYGNQAVYFRTKMTQRHFWL
jgi:hypothetical protein